MDAAGQEGVKTLSQDLYPFVAVGLPPGTAKFQIFGLRR
jgi:hypothetical protein